MADLNLILDELNAHKRDKEKLLAFYIQKRLSESVQTYYKDINNSVQYLKTRDQLQIAKKLSRDDYV